MHSAKICVSRRPICGSPQTILAASREASACCCITKLQNPIYKFGEICVYKLIASHLRRPMWRNYHAKFTQLITKIPKLNDDATVACLVVRMPISFCKFLSSLHFFKCHWSVRQFVTDISSFWQWMEPKLRGEHRYSFYLLPWRQVSM